MLLLQQATRVGATNVGSPKGGTNTAEGHKSGSRKSGATTGGKGDCTALRLQAELGVTAAVAAL